ncbi:unnamed protein product [Pylaiella littoralis]
MFDLFQNREICRNILSFTENDYLFMGTINHNFNKSYRGQHLLTKTSYIAGIDGYTRTDESIESGFKKIENVYRYMP